VSNQDLLAPRAQEGADAPSTAEPGAPGPGGDTPPPLGGARKRRRVSQARALVAPVVTFVLVIAAWELAVVLFNIPKYLLPSPQDVVPHLWNDHSELMSNAWVTIEEVLIGFAISIVLGIPLGLLLALSRTAYRALYPLLVIIQLIPKIAVAPLFLVWFGFDLTPKVLLTVLLTFFPLLLASISAFQLLDQRLLYLTRSMGASRWQTFRELRLPSALPVIFSGLKTSGTIAVTAAIVAEFVGANNGLGYLLLQQTSQLNTEYMFAILIVLTVLGLLLNYLIELAEYLSMPWRRHLR